MQNFKWQIIYFTINERILFMKKIVAIDLDGTLLHSDCTISSYSKEVIAEAVKNGIMVVPTSGRSFRSIKNQVQDIEGVKYCICANGTLVGNIQTEELLHNCKIPQNLVYDIYKEVKERHGFIELYCDNDAYVEKDTAPIIYDTKMGKDFCDSMLSTDVIGLSYDLLLRRGTMRINKIHVAFPDPQELREFAAKTAENKELIVTFPSEYNMEIFPNGCNKDVGIRILAEKYHIPQEDTVAIGDSDNDVAMIEYAHIGIAVANAMEVLKEKADYITKSNDEDGPAIVLKKILEK
ncbi:Cof-type HAD-IIB family hydrolase [Anaerobutyricum hallii]|jgi:Cof subfamily protein (haloacid dehalogenase superfamily)|nr:Cof-type HAD-IIB family hydrolase [Anaerobutyricum hallii]